MSQQDKIQLTIRCALQTFSDYNIECFSNWTVLQLKEHLTQICDFKPEVERQRLIYAGHCLKNEQTIKDVLKQQRDGMPRSPDEQLEKQVIHMVYTGNVSPPNVRHRSAAATTSTPSSSLSNGQNTSQSSSVNGAGIPMVMPVPTNNFYPTQQQDQNQAWMNAYQQYMAQMMPFYKNAVGMPYGVQWPMWNPLSQAAFAQQAVFAQFSNAAAFGQQFPHIQQQQIPPQMPLVANVQQNNEVNRAAPDFLDIIYKSIRFALLAMILLLYSSIERFVFVLVMVGIFWFVNARRGRQQRGRDEGAAAEAARALLPPREVQDQIVQQPEVNDGNLTPTIEQTTPNNAVNVWNIFWGTVQSFFTSLIPENQPPLDVN
jgi:hypothetical protein